MGASEEASEEALKAEAVQVARLALVTESQRVSAQES